MQRIISNFILIVVFCFYYWGIAGEPASNAAGTVAMHRDWLLGGYIFL